MGREPVILTIKSLDNQPKGLWRLLSAFKKVPMRPLISDILQTIAEKTGGEIEIHKGVCKIFNATREEVERALEAVRSSIPDYAFFLN